MEEKEKKNKFEINAHGAVEKILIYIGLLIFALAVIYIGIEMLIMMIGLLLVLFFIWADFIDSGIYFSNLFTKMEITNIEFAKTLLIWSIVPLIIGIISMIVYLFVISLSKKKSKIPLIIGLIYIIIFLVMIFSIKYL